MSQEDTTDDAPTITSQAFRSQAIRKAIRDQAGKFETTGQYVAATLDAEFRGPQFFLEGTATVAIAVFDRATGMRIGEAVVTIPVPFSAEHRRDE